MSDEQPPVQYITLHLEGATSTQLAELQKEPLPVGLLTTAQLAGLTSTEIAFPQLTEAQLGALNAAPKAPLVVSRTCGDCNLCCKLLGVIEIEKPTNVWCKDCTPGKGCNIYNTRPRSCVDFECLWLQMQDTMPDYTKPSQSKVVLAAPASGPIGIMAWVDQSRPDAWKEGVMGGIIARLAESTIVCIVVGDHRKLFGPEAMIKERLPTIKEALEKTVVIEGGQHGA